MAKYRIDQHIFICDQCGSVLTLNSGHPKIQCGDWMPVLKDSKSIETGVVLMYLDCPACGGNLVSPEDFVKDHE